MRQALADVFFHGKPLLISEFKLVLISVIADNDIKEPNETQDKKRARSERVESHGSASSHWFAFLTLASWICLEIKWHLSLLTIRWGLEGFVR